MIFDHDFQGHSRELKYSVLLHGFGCSNFMYLKHLSAQLTKDFFKVTREISPTRNIQGHYSRSLEKSPNSHSNLSTRLSTCAVGSWQRKSLSWLQGHFSRSLKNFSVWPRSLYQTEHLCSGFMAKEFFSWLQGHFSRSLKNCLVWLWSLYQTEHLCTGLAKEFFIMTSRSFFKVTR